MAAFAPAAMVLAAGRGTRLEKLGAASPKALMELGGRPAIVRVLERLRAAGIRRCVINLHHLGEQIEAVVGDGGALGIEVAYAREPELLDVAGGIANALELLGAEPFVVANADICSDLDFARPVAVAGRLGEADGHLFLGANPPFRPAGDFSLDAGRLVRQAGATPGHTYIGTAVYRPQLFAGLEAGAPAAMGPLWDRAIAAGRLAGELHPGWWIDIGTPQRLAEAAAIYAAREG